MRILAVGAHPDDIEILCAGTLAACRARGDTIVMAVATDGRMGHKEILPPELAAVRRREQEESCKILGAELIWMGIRDEFVFDNEATRSLFIDLYRQAKPDFVLTHWNGCYHPDHRGVEKLMWDAGFVSSVKHVETGFPYHPAVTPFFHMEPLAGVEFIPTEYVDISPYFDVKRRMLECHQSQLKWLKDHDGIDIVEFMTTVSRFRGIQAGVKYAEGYRRVNTWPRGTAQRLLP